MSCPREPQLQPYLSGKLPTAEAQAFSEHLAGCRTCPPQVKALAPVHRVLRHHQPFDPEELNDLELARLDRNVLAAVEKARQAPEPRGVNLWAILGLTAATAALLLVVARPGPEKVEPVVIHPPPAQRTMALVAGLGPDALVVGPQGESALLAPARLVQGGDRLTTGSGSLTLQTGPATGVHLPRGGEVSLERLEEGRTELRLLQGELLAEVKPLASGASFEVRCRDLVVAVRGTAFVVKRLAHSTLVEVDHGLVQVTREGTDQSVLLPGRTRLEVDDGLPLASAAPSAVDKARREFPLGFPDVELEEVASQHKPLSIQSDPTGARVWVDGRFRGLTPVTVVEPEGAHAVRLEYDGRPNLDTTLETGAPPQILTWPVEAPPLDEVVKREARAPEIQKIAAPKSNGLKKAPLPPPEDPKSALLRATMQQVVMQHRTDLKGCFERAAKRNPSLVGTEGEVVVEFSLTFDAIGAIQQVTANDSADPGFVECAREVIQRWGVPGTGEEEELVVPLKLKVKN